MDIYQAHPVCRSFRAGPSPVLNIGASTGLKYRRPSFLSVESWYLISLPLLPIDMNNQFRPPGNAGFESWRRRQEPISPHRAPSAAEQLLHQVQVNSQPWQRGSYGPPSMDYPRTSLRAPSSLPTHGGTPHACQEENERLKNELQFVIKAHQHLIERVSDLEGQQSCSKTCLEKWQRMEEHLQSISHQMNPNHDTVDPTSLMGNPLSNT